MSFFPVLFHKRAGGFSMPYSVDFSALGDGSLPSPWTGATWAISSSKAVNTPTLGAELFVDPGIENWSDATTPSTWTKSETGTSTVNREGSVIHGGTYACRSDVDASNSAVYIIINPAVTAQKWYQAHVWARADSGTPTAQIVGANRTFTLSTSYQQFYVSYRAAAVYIALQNLSAASKSIYWDDASVKEITGGTQFNVFDHGASDVEISAGTTVTTATDGLAGVAVACDGANPSNGIIGFTNRNNIYLHKFVAGTYTQLIASAIAYSDDKVIKVTKSGSTVKLYYDGVQVGSNQTVSDAGIVDNTYHGLLGTLNTSIVNYLAEAA